MTIAKSGNKNITKLLNSYTKGITITLQCLLQSTKHTLRHGFQLERFLGRSISENHHVSLKSITLLGGSNSKVRFG